MRTHRETITDQIAADVIARIQRGELKPGDPVREQALARRFNTSRGPVREALRMLDSTYWVNIEPGKGARVARIETGFMIDEVMIAQVLNGLAARLAAVRADPDAIDEIERRVRVIVELAPTDVTPEAFSDHTWALGRMITDLAASPKLAEQIGARSQGGLLHLAQQGVATPERRRQVARLWTELAVAFRMRDGIAAEHAMRELIDAAIRAVFRAQINGGTQ